MSIVKNIIAGNHVQARKALNEGILEALALVIEEKKPLIARSLLGEASIIDPPKKDDEEDDVDEFGNPVQGDANDDGDMRDQEDDKDMDGIPNEDEDDEEPEVAADQSTSGGVRKVTVVVKTEDPVSGGGAAPKKPAFKKDAPGEDEMVDDPQAFDKEPFGDEDEDENNFQKKKGE